MILNPRPQFPKTSMFLLNLSQRSVDHSPKKSTSVLLVYSSLYNSLCSHHSMTPHSIFLPLSNQTGRSLPLRFGPSYQKTVVSRVSTVPVQFVFQYPLCYFVALSDVRPVPYSYKSRGYNLPVWYQSGGYNLPSLEGTIYRADTVYRVQSTGLVECTLQTCKNGGSKSLRD